MLSGPGQTIDPDDPSTFEIHPFYGDTTPAGIINANKGYLFDPTGALTGGDGIPFSGDELMAPTGYFFTYNFLEANQVFTGVLDAVLAATGGDLLSSLTAAADSVAWIYVESDTSAMVGASVGQALYDEYAACLGTGASADACAAIFA